MNLEKQEKENSNNDKMICKDKKIEELYLRYKDIIGGLRWNLNLNRPPKFRQQIEFVGNIFWGTEFSDIHEFAKNSSSFESRCRDLGLCKILLNIPFLPEFREGEKLTNAEFYKVLEKNDFFSIVNLLIKYIRENFNKQETEFTETGHDPWFKEKKILDNLERKNFQTKIKNKP